MARKAKKKTFTKAAYVKRATSRQQTAARHEGMRAITVHLKVQNNHLSHAKRKALNDAFRQGKYLRNWAISQHKEGTKFTQVNTKVTSVPVKIGEDEHGEPIFEERSIKALGSQVKQGITDRLQHNENAIITKRKQGEKAGDQGYKSDLRSLYLKQYGNTFAFDDKHKRVHLQCIGWVRMNGGKQLVALCDKYGIENVEIASANLLHIGCDFYLNVSVYVPWTEDELRYRSNRRTRHVEEEDNSYERCDGVVCSDFVRGTANIGGLRVVSIDLGVSGLKCSDGSVASWFFPETECLKAAQRVNQAYRDYTERQTGRASSSLRQRRVMAREYYHLGCRKDDAANKFVAGLLADFDVVVVQDDSLPSWNASLSDEAKVALHHSLAGRIKERLLRSPRVIVVDRFVGTTRVCGDCYHVVSEGIPVGVREWVCSECESEHERDFNATDVMRIVSSLALGEYATLVLDNAVRSTSEMRSVFKRVYSNEANRVLSMLRKAKNPVRGVSVIGQ